MISSIHKNNNKRKRRGKGKSKGKRHPSGYWMNKTNVLHELYKFWSDVNVPIPTPTSHTPSPPIPSEALLNHFKRHDLRWGIACHGGREALSVRLSGARIIPGRWKDAVQVEEVRAILDPNNDASIGLSPYYPPISLYSFQTQSVESSSGRRYKNGLRWSHNQQRNHWGFWNKETLLDELNTFLMDHSDSLDNRPFIFMPRMAEFSKLGRQDLRGAIVRFGGLEDVANSMGMIAPYEWEYFESLYHLILRLNAYLDKHHHYSAGSNSGVSHKLFPSLSDIKKNDSKLFSLVQRHGGRKLVANRLGFSSISSTSSGSKYSVPYDVQYWGEFSLEFAIEMLSFVRETLSSLKPSLKNTNSTSLYLTIDMPSKHMLEQSSIRGQLLLKQIESFGGFEQVARRLGLNIFHNNINEAWK